MSTETEMLTRKNVWELGSTWASETLWYARGVRAMKAKALADRTSWRFYAAIHGMNPELWALAGYLSGDALPPSADITTFWEQCQHGSWYFLPWHRGYLLAFEKCVRAEVVKLGGPSDWALPYWNYFKPGQDALPLAFSTPDWPDGTGDNPLFEARRFGPDGDGNVFVPLSDVNLNAMAEDDFTGVPIGGSPGFGGVDTGFAHGGRVHGLLETQPHDWVHGLVGGGDGVDQRRPGLMSHPGSAALDPIFWLHHANTDRLWQVWRENPVTNVDPTEANWLSGPASTGDRAFVLPLPDGTTWVYAPAQMASLAALEYAYDDLSPALAPTPLKMRVAKLRGTEVDGAAPVKSQKSVELVGASTEVQVRGAEVRAAVKLEPQAKRKVVASLKAAAVAAPPDRVFLNLENVRGDSDTVAFRVYVGLPDGAAPDQAHLAGSIALFGVGKASTMADGHGGSGLTFVLEITQIIDKLHLENALDAGTLSVRLVPVRPVANDTNTSIGRIGIFRQGS
jgi:tyrosinase